MGAFLALKSKRIGKKCPISQLCKIAARADTPKRRKSSLRDLKNRQKMECRSFCKKTVYNISKIR